MKYRIMTLCVAFGIATAAMAAGETLGSAQVPNLVCAIKVQTDKAPDCTSLKSIAETVTRGCTNNDAKAVAILNFILFTFYHQPYASEPGGIPALKVINCYGWGVCGGTAAVQSALWRELGWNWRFIGWPGHTTVEANYDGRWHYLDAFYKYYAWMPDGKGGQTIASEDDLFTNKKDLIDTAMVHDVGRKCGYFAGDTPVSEDGTVNWQARELLDCDDYDLETAKEGGFQWNVPSQRSRVGASDGWAGYNHADGNYSMAVNLAPGFAFENTWQAMPDAWYWGGRPGDIAYPHHGCGNHKDTRNNPGYGLVIEPYTQDRCWGNGILTFNADLSDDAGLKSFVASDNVKVAGQALVPIDAAKPAFVVAQLASPYILVEAGGEAAGAEKIEVSVDDGKTFKPAELQDFGAAIKGQLAAQVKVYVKDALKSLKLRAIVQNNPFALPYLSPGKNVVSVSVREPAALGTSKLVVTYAYQLGFRTKTYEEIIEKGGRVANQSYAQWSDKTTCVQRVFSAKELPATFEIDCPTPKGKTPVYPRMVFIRREVIAPSGSPLPLPDSAVAAKPRVSDEELATLPNPFLLGTRPPAGRVELPRTTNVVATLGASHAVCINGETAANHFIRWPPDNKAETWVMLVGGELEGLPDSKKIARATLAIPVVRGKNQAATKVCVVALKAPFEAGKPYDFANLGDIVGTVTVPKQEGPDYNPPRLFRADLTQYVKQLTPGEAKFIGFAIRVQQDRSVDEGYLIRIDMPNAAQLPLEVETLVKAP